MNALPASPQLSPIRRRSLLCSSPHTRQPFGCCQEAFMEKATVSRTVHKGFRLDCKGMIKHIIVITEIGLSCGFSLHKASCQRSSALAKSTAGAVAPWPGLLCHGTVPAASLQQPALSPMVATCPAPLWATPLPPAPAVTPPHPGVAACTRGAGVIGPRCSASFVEEVLRSKVLAHVCSGLVCL